MSMFSDIEPNGKTYNAGLERRNDRPVAGVIARVPRTAGWRPNLDSFFPYSLLCRFRPVIGLLSIPYVLAIHLADVRGVKVPYLPVCRFP
jgi:hypothetical protein